LPYNILQQNESKNNPQTETWKSLYTRVPPNIRPHYTTSLPQYVKCVAITKCYAGKKVQQEKIQ